MKQACRDIAHDPILCSVARGRRPQLDDERRDPNSTLTAGKPLTAGPYPIPDSAAIVRRRR